MKRAWSVNAFVVALRVATVFAGCAAGLVACGDDTLVTPADAGPDASVAMDAAGFDTGTFDGAGLGDGAPSQGDSGAPPPARMLLSYAGPTQSELAVFGLRSGTVDGRILYPGSLGTTAITDSSPWLLQPQNDVVARLDPIQPWLVRSSFSVALHDGPDGGADAGPASPSSDPVAVVVGAGTKAYVLRYSRNLLAVIDTSLDVDGGAPVSAIDLSGLVQAGGDGVVEMTAGYFDPQSGRVYLLLGNVDRGAVAADGHTLVCGTTHPTVVAIDTASGALVSLGDAGTAGYGLSGYAPTLGPSPMVYDPANNRLLVLESGCSAASGDGGAAVISRRGVEAVSLTDGAVTSLLDLSGSGPPRGLFYVDEHHVIVQLGATGAAYAWDPSSSALGPVIANAPSTFALDGQGNLVGLSPQVASDGGTGGFSVVAVDRADGGVTTLGQNPFSTSGGTPGTVSLWPAP